MNANIDLPMDRIEAFCRKWQVVELSLFGSVLTPEFRPDSDVDVLAVFAPDAVRGAWDHLHAEEELADILGRRVDLVERCAVRNPIRRRHVLRHREVVYAA